MNEEYEVSTKQKKIWEIEKIILLEFMRVCNEYKLKFFVAHGTLLGAIRHKGFIPWDDDIDVNMPRDDFERMKKNASQYFKSPFFLQWYESDNNNFWGCAKLRYENATGMDFQDIVNNRETNNGLYIDIFPMDSVIDDEVLRTKQSRKIEFYRKLMFAKVYGKHYRKFLYIGTNEWLFNKFMCSFLSAKYIYRKFESWVQKYNDIETKRTGIHAFKTDYECCYWYREDYENLTMVPFDDIMVPVPSNYDRCLKIKWNNYMEFPPKSERGKKHFDVIMDGTVPYKDYDVSCFNWTCKQLNKKEVVIFGTGKYASEFYQRYSKKVKIVMALDNNVQKNGTLWNGVPVVLPSIDIVEDDLIIIIAIRDFRDVIVQLKDMGIKRNYYIFMPERIY